MTVFLTRGATVIGWVTVRVPQGSNMAVLATLMMIAVFHVKLFTHARASTMPPSVGDTVASVALTAPDRSLPVGQATCKVGKVTKADALTVGRPASFCQVTFRVPAGAAGLFAL